ncbi:cyclopropane-fatty-acyl-phospholipid synthase [Vibrio azureus]|uniref:Cyclopropane-fatty-acyl-phospholipid synthase n=1 Tax=Vibrio azureus NBRC 104587 TaxID=1219077 RepID=U3ARF1_9VIBR|nr:cyclopropane fatty acyl phospholipid synthase [Vibrio azureus]AUI87918.1 cyclopropane-fatty-acyl-phospholipid synthase [Vibrio azureus]GAD76315.1 cyclopropane-fatty-acyl-phospholipid synthase [Vibrio azureus NBRC 104587]
MNYYNFFKELLKNADIKLDGDRTWDIKVKDVNMFSRIIECGSLGLGESYVDEMWECEDLSTMTSKLLSSDIESKLTISNKLSVGASLGKQKLKKLFNPQSISQAKVDVSSHYDLGNDLYERMLDPRMTYTCGYWKEASDLAQAQEHKLDLLCRKLGLSKGMRVLDIGCGWGSFMQFAAEKYGVICDGLTLSKEQAELGQSKANDAGLPINFILQDYREYRPEYKYDAVVSVGMIEHVGPSNYREYFECADRFMKEESIFLLHTIGSSISKVDCEPWIDKYIFPNGVIPSLAQLAQAMEPKFNIEDLHNFGPDYDLTLCAWYENFEQSWPELQSKYGERFFRIWRYYLLSCAGAFRARDISLWQLALTKGDRSLPESVRAV